MRITPRPERDGRGGRGVAPRTHRLVFLGASSAKRDTRQTPQSGSCLLVPINAAFPNPADGSLVVYLFGAGTSYQGHSLSRDWSKPWRPATSRTILIMPTSMVQAAGTRLCAMMAMSITSTTANVTNAASRKQTVTDHFGPHPPPVAASRRAAGGSGARS
jgi:hypothetical protein